MFINIIVLFLAVLGLFFLRKLYTASKKTDLVTLKKQNQLVKKDNSDNFNPWEDDGWRVGNCGYGYYSSGVRIDSENND